MPAVNADPNSTFNDGSDLGLKAHVQHAVRLAPKDWTEKTTSNDRRLSKKGTFLHFKNPESAKFTVEGALEREKHLLQLDSSSLIKDTVFHLRPASVDPTSDGCHCWPRKGVCENRQMVDG